MASRSLAHDAVAQVLLAAEARSPSAVRDEAERTRARREELRAEVRGHHDHRVAEVDRATLAVGQASVVEHLQQQVEHVGVRLLDLVEQHDRVRVAPHALGELPGLVVADVSGRGADEARHGVPLAELAHVEADDRAARRRRATTASALRQLGLADTRRAEEQERTDRPVRVAHAGAVAAHGLGDRGDRVVLADDARVQLVLEVAEALALALGEAVHRDAGGAGDHRGDLGLVDHRRRSVSGCRGAAGAVASSSFACTFEISSRMRDASS